MDSRKKKNLITTGTYIVLSFSFIVLIGVGMFTTLRSSMPEKPEEMPPKTVVDEIAVEPKLQSAPELPVIPENNEVFEPELLPEDDISSVSEPAKEIEEAHPVPVYFLPCEGEIIKDFSKDSLVFSETMKDYRTHSGIDIACEAGGVVKSFTDGTIESFTNDPLNGITMTVKHSDELLTRYCNLSSELPEGIEVGTVVRAGDSIAYVGDPGILECGEGTHLHFEIEVSGVKTGLSSFELQ